MRNKIQEGEMRKILQVVGATLETMAKTIVYVVAAVTGIIEGTCWTVFLLGVLFPSTGLLRATVEITYRLAMFVMDWYGY